MTTDAVRAGAERAAPETADLKRLMEQLVPLNRTIVSDDMDRAADLLDRVAVRPATRYRYPSGSEHGSWIVPPSWNIREAFLSDGKRVLASVKDHILFLAPYSMPFEGWISREELLTHIAPARGIAEAFSYQHRIAYDFRKRLKRWEISLPRSILNSLNRDSYFVKIDVDVRPGTMNVLEFTEPGREETAVMLLAHLCHSGQANDGLSGVLAGLSALSRLGASPHRLTYKLLVMPETIGSAVHIIAQGLSPQTVAGTIFLETVGTGERLYLKRTRTGTSHLDRAINSLVREQPDVGVLGFLEGYGNDELVFDFANVAIPSAGIQYHPFPEYHTSRDTPAIIDWAKWNRAVELTEAFCRRIEADRLIRLRFPGPPYLTRYGLYVDSVLEHAQWEQINQALMRCDGRHTLLEICEESGMPFLEATRFFDALEHEGLLA